MYVTQRGAGACDRLSHNKCIRSEPFYQLNHEKNQQRVFRDSKAALRIFCMSCICTQASHSRKLCSSSMLRAAITVRKKKALHCCQLLAMFFCHLDTKTRPPTVRQAHGRIFKEKTTLTNINNKNSEYTTQYVIRKYTDENKFIPFFLLLIFY